MSIVSNGYYNIVSLGTDFRLDSNSAGSVYGHVANTGNYQKWQLIEVSPNTFLVLDYATNLYLTMNAKHVTTDGRLTGSASVEQLWKLIQVVDESDVYKLENVGTSHFLDGNAAGSIYGSSPNNGQYQDWKFTPVSV